MDDVRHLSMTELEAGLDEIRRSPSDGGVLELIVRRPRTDEREVLVEGELDTELKDGRRFKLTAGMSYQVSDFGDAAHRSSTQVGAKLFVVD